MPSETVGLIGLGLLGSALAERLSGGGFEVLGHDIDPRREGVWARGGCRFVEDLEQISACRRIVLCLPNSDVVHTVIHQLAPSLHAGTTILDATTGHPQAAREIAAMLRAGGIDYLEATVAGSSEQARNREAIVLCGGESDVLSACRDLLDCFAREVFHVGPSGAGAQMKLVVNLVLGLNRAVLAEGLAYARASAIDPETALEILQAGPAYSGVMDTKGEKMLCGDFAPQARLAQHLKDVRLILETGASCQARLPFSQLHAELLERLVHAGWAEADNAAIIRAFDRTET